MISQILMIFTLISIWLSLAWGLVILISAVQFWLKHSDFRVDTSPLLYYPKVTIVVPAHMKIGSSLRLQGDFGYELPS